MRNILMALVFLMTLAYNSAEAQINVGGYYNGYGYSPGYTSYKNGWNSTNYAGGHFWFRNNYTYPLPTYSNKSYPSVAPPVYYYYGRPYQTIQNNFRIVPRGDWYNENY